MMTYRVIWSLFIILATSAMAAAAQGLSYLGSSPDAPSGWIELAPGQVIEVRVGDNIPGWGRVTKISPMHLVVERWLSEAEQARLRSQGMAVYGVLELQIPRADLGGQTLSPP